MKICFISPYTSRGGAELSLMELIDALSPLGINCTCIVRGYGEIVDLLADRGVETMVVPFKRWVHIPRSSFQRVLKMMPHRQVAGAIRLASAIKRTGCDVVYTNSVTAGAGAMAAKLAGKPHIWHLREFGQEDFQLSYDWGLKFSRRLINRLSSACIANSMAVADAYRDDLAGTPLSVVYNAVEVPTLNDDDIASSAWWRNPDALHCILLGKYMPGKGQEDAVRAMKKLREINVPAELLLAGETVDKQYQQYIEQLIKRHDLTDRVRMLGHTRKPAPMMNSADVVLMCSRREAFGRVTVEGMKLGKPVIGTRSGGTPEIIDEGVTGYLYDAGDHEGLAAKIARLENKALRSEMGSVARARARARFSREKYGADVATVIQSVLGSLDQEPVAPGMQRESKRRPIPVVTARQGNPAGPSVRVPFESGNAGRRTQVR